MKTSRRVCGVHSALAAINYTSDQLVSAWIDKNRKDNQVAKIRETLSNLGTTVQSVDKKQLDRLAKGENHQGVVIELLLPKEFGDVELKQAIQSNTDPALFLVLDQVQDPHNFGACLRTADAIGAQGLITTKDNSASLTPTVCKVASGAAETVPVYRVTNLSRTLQWIKKQGIWVIGTDKQAEQSVFDLDLTGPVAIVMGAEGKGLRRLTRERCDFLVSLPMYGQVDSLNVSVAVGVFLYEVIRQRSDTTS